MSSFFERYPWVALILILAAYCVVCTMDYEDARKQECAPRNYNAQGDVCE